MAFTQQDKDQLVGDFDAVIAAAQTGLSHANALVVETVDVAALQQQLANSNAAKLAAETARDKALDKVARIVAKMDAADAADVAEDQARADVRSIAAE